MNKLFLALIISFLPRITVAQSNCSNPVIDTLCKSTTFLNQTNAGMIDDAPAGINSSGEDLVYHIWAPAGALRIYVSLQNLNAFTRLTLLTGSCTASNGILKYGYSGNNNIVFYVSSNTDYYLWVDAGSTITYNISIGGDTSAQYINIPNTLGSWGFSNCAPQPFAASKPYFEVRYNSVYKVQPLTLSPLNVSGILCVSFYLENLTGNEGLKNVIVVFNPAGFHNISPVVNSVPGFYNTGNWNLNNSTSNSFSFLFADSAGIGRGDFDGSPNVCLRYDFCFNVTPVSNNPLLTDVNVTLYGDKYGAPVSGYVYSGCCPFGFSNCHGGAGGGGGSTGLAFGFNDPGGGLPITLIDFNAKQVRNSVKLNWSTASEINNDYFTIERSIDGEKWEFITRVDGAGNSSNKKEYTFSDEHPVKGKQFYRLSQTDYDGTTVRLRDEACNFISKELKIYPLPARDFVSIEYEFDNNKIELINVFGEIVKSFDVLLADKIIISLHDIPSGIYFLNVIDGNAIPKTMRLVIEN
jgi:hypothetical protein